MHVIHHGVDRRQFHAGVRSQHWAATREELGIAESEVGFLFVGDARKGAVQAIDALADVPGQLVIVTRSDHGPLREAARLAGVASRVVLMPPTEHIERFYGAADVFVLASRDEAMPYATNQNNLVLRLADMADSSAPRPAAPPEPPKSGPDSLLDMIER
jgi:glycosyltransferase involved in cell wall biosynthesis